jgi:hypothetical protein
LAHTSIAEAVPLGYALVARVAQDAGVRALAIKGPVTQTYGLRDGGRPPPRDIDILVSPRQLSALVDALVGAGWSTPPTSTSGRAMPQGALAMRHPLWPCEIDIHWDFQGLLAEPHHVFEKLWAARVPLSVAATNIPSVDERVALIMEYLHIARSGSDEQNKMKVFLALVSAKQLTPSDMLWISSQAAAIGAHGPLTPLMGFLGITEAPRRENERPGLDQLWRARTKYGQAVGTHTVLELKRTPWRSLPRRLWEMAWLTDEQLTSAQLAKSGSRKSLLQARWRRWWRFIKNSRTWLPVLFKRV